MESRSSFGDILGHGEIDGSFLVIPVQVDATKKIAIAVDG